MIAIANDAARKTGFDLSEFQPPQADFECRLKNFTWSVFYQGIVLYLDHLFLVVVDDRTKQTTLRKGL